MTRQCDQCGKVHGYTTFEKIGEIVYWFCGEFCKRIFTDEQARERHSQREFGHGGWQ